MKVSGRVGWSTSTRWLAPARIVANQEASVTCASVSRPITAHSVRRRELLARLCGPGTPLGFQSRDVAGVQASDLGGSRGRSTDWRPRTERGSAAGAEFGVDHVFSQESWARLRMHFAIKSPVGVFQPPIPVEVAKERDALAFLSHARTAQKVAVAGAVCLSLDDGTGAFARGA